MVLCINHTHSESRGLANSLLRLFRQEPTSEAVCEERLGTWADLLPSGGLAHLPALEQLSSGRQWGRP